MPHQESPLLTWPVDRLVRLVLRYPIATIVVGVVVALGSIGLMASKLEMRTNRLDLLNPNSGFNKLWLDHIAEFGGDDDSVVVVEGPDSKQVEAAIDAVATELARQPELFHDILHKVDPSPLRAKQLHFATQGQLAELDQGLDLMQPIITGDWSGLKIDRLLEGLAAMSQFPDPRTQKLALSTLDTHLNNMLAVLTGEGVVRSAWEQLPTDQGVEDPFKVRYFTSNAGRLGLIALHIKVDNNNAFDRSTRAIESLRRILANVQPNFEGVKLGLTGLPVMENDEMRASEAASSESSTISLIGVAVLFIAGFGGVRHPLLAVGALIVSMGWTCGFMTLAVGHLNVLSMSFGVILIGMGIDFGIHIVARYLQVRPQEDSCEKALLATMAGIGPGIVSGAVTTAVAFLAISFSDFPGLSELGIIAGGGIMLCLLAMLTLLPAMILLMDRNRKGQSLPTTLSFDKPLQFARYIPRTVILATLLVTLMLAIGSGRLWYDHNLLNLQPSGLESVALEHHMLEEMDESVWYAVSRAKSREELLTLKAKFEKLRCVERTEEIVSFLPPSEQDNRQAIAEIQKKLAPLADAAPLLSVETPQSFAAAIMQVRKAGESIDPKIVQRCDAIYAALGKLPLAEYYARVARYQQGLAVDLQHRLSYLRSISDPNPPALADLPPGLVNRFVGKNGTLLLRVYAKGDIWDMPSLEKFVAGVRSVDPMATGQPLQTYEASYQFQRSYLWAALYAGIGVLLMLVLDFRNLTDTLLALIPLALGMLQMFGIMGWLNMPLNPANMIVLPLILGIGVDFGVHVVHDYRSQKGKYRLNRSTATAVILASLCTMVGFGSLMIADHRGLESFGRVLTIGVAFCTVGALVPLPALLAWMSRNRGEEVTVALDEAAPTILPIDASVESAFEGEADTAPVGEIAARTEKPAASYESMVTRTAA